MSDDTSQIRDDVFEGVGSIGTKGGQTALLESKNVSKTIINQVFGGKPKVPETSDAKAADLEQKKIEEKAKSEAEAQQILAQLEEEMTKYRAQREKEKEEYRQSQVTTATPAPKIEENQVQQAEEVAIQKSRAEKSASFRGE